MSTTTARRRRDDSPGKTMLATSTVIFGAAMLGVVGVFQLLEGIAAVAKDDVYVRGVAYTYEFDVTTWGWIHIVVGAVAAAVSVGIFLDQVWARIAGIGVAVLGAVASFAFVPYYPLWSLVVLAFYGLAIWALCYQLGED
jgi:hypothetical protein